jgi:hypothetical protein
MLPKYLPLPNTDPNSALSCPSWTTGGKSENQKNTASRQMTADDKFHEGR